MTATTKSQNTASLGDRFAEAAVILVTLVALVLGWVLMTSVVNRSVPLTGGDVSARVPAGWLTLKPAGDEVLHVTDRTTSGFGTTYIIQEEAVPADFGTGEFVSLLTLNRGSSLTAYRVLDQQPVQVGGRDAVQIRYVESDPNVAHADIPAVVFGLDYVFVSDGRAVVVSYHADQSAYESDLSRFYRFLASVNF
jgi:hypothetical protein